MKLLNVAWHTVKNCTRQPFYLISFLFTVIAALALPILSQFSLYDQQKMLLDSIFGLILAIGIILTILVTEYSIGNDFCNELALLLFSKPIGFINYAFGKLLGNTIVILIYLLFSWLVLINIQSVVIQNFFFNFYKFGSFAISIILAFILGALINYFFRKNFSLTTLISIFVLLTINSIFWLSKNNNAEFTVDLLRQSKTYLMLAMFILFIGSAALPLAVKLKSSGILVYTIAIITLGLLAPNLFPSLNDYWLVDYYNTGLDVSFSLILKAFLNIFIYSLFFTITLYVWLKHSELGRINK